MQASDLEFGDLISQCAEVVRSNSYLILATVFLTTAGVSLISLVPNISYTFTGLFISVYVQYHFVEALVPNGVATTKGLKRKYGSLFLTVFLGQLGILFGMLFLILPGVFLMARWAISTPFVVAEGMNGTDALKASWHATSKARWPLFFVFLACSAALAGLLLIVSVGAAAFDLAQDSLPLSIALNFLVSLWVVGGWILGVGIYRCLKPPLGGLTEVFT